jgi:hydrogenase maturation protease
VSVELAPSVVVVGVGNALRGDDAAGLEVVRRMRELLDKSRTGEQAQIAVLEHEREPLGLIDQWEGAAAVVLVDAIQSGAQPGTIHRIDASAAPIPAELRGFSSTHAVGVADAIELARALGRLPARVIVYGVEGVRFNAGGGFSRELDAVIESLAGRVLGEACSLVA